MKKAAILIYGMYREFAEVRDKWCDIERFYDCDYYMSTWDISSQKYRNSERYKTFNVTPDMITNHLPNCVFQILNQKEIFPISPSSTQNYVFFHWKNVYRLMEESNKEYDIVFLIRADAPLTIDTQDTKYVKEWVDNHPDVLYSHSHMFVYQVNPFMFHASEEFQAGSPEIMSKLIKTMPDTTDINIHLRSHIDLATHIISVGLCPSSSIPFSAHWHVPYDYRNND
jgi:hypothetical protein